MKKLLVVGSVAYDAIETPLGKTDRILGGAGTYIALAAFNFDIKIGVVSIIGEDFLPEHMQLLTDRDIDVSGIEIVKGGKTFFWKGKYHNDMNTRDTLDTQLNVLERFSPKVSEDFKDASVVVLGNLHPLVQLSVLDQMTTPPKLIILDTMNFWIESALEDLKKIIQRTDVISINDDEARQLTGKYSLVTAAQKITAMGPKTVIIKKGEHGALLFQEGKIFSAPAFPLAQVFDPTGAGDTFAGGFAGHLAEADDISFDTMKTAIIKGSNLASFCVEKFGTEQLQTLTSSALAQRLKQFAQLTQFSS